MYLGIHVSSQPSTTNPPQPPSQSFHTHPQPYYEKVFDSIGRVVHSKADRSQIVEIQSAIGSAIETIVMDTPVKAVGNIEDWLGVLELEMQVSVCVYMEWYME